MISSADTKLVETQRAIIDAAKKAGVLHIVELSGLGSVPESRFQFARMHAELAT